MPYDSNMERALVAALSTEDVSRELIQGMTNESAALGTFRRVTISKNQTRLPVLATLPTAYFVNGDTGLKQTSQVEWENKYLNVEELAVILPIPEAVLDDSDYDIWGEVRPLAVDAATRALDAAVLFGTNKPASWPTAIAPAADAAGNIVVRGTTAANAGGLSADISNAFAAVEADGYDVSSIIANRTYKGLLRNIRDADGNQLNEVGVDSIYGVGVQYPARGLWPTGTSAYEMIVGDASQAIVGVRQDFTFKLLDQAALFDASGNLIYNLPQQDMIALRMVFRVAFQVANTITYDNTNDSTRYPFAVVESPAG